MSVYLDWAATAVPDKNIAESIHRKYLEYYANPSSLHSEGIKSKNLVNKSRIRCADLLGVNPESIVFTSGGTESNNTALFSVFGNKKKGIIITSGIEHPSVSEPLKLFEKNGWQIITVDPDSSGIISPLEIEKNLTADAGLVSVMHVNNETGAVQPVEEIAAVIKSFNRRNSCRVVFHCDAVQGTGKIMLDFDKSMIDMISVSAHKFAGPKGTGLLYCRKKITPYITGGGQEDGIRSGTENIPSIYGISLALEKTYSNMDGNYNNAWNLNRLLLSEIIRPDLPLKIIPECRIENPAMYTPYILNIAAGKIPAEVLARVLSDRGFYISAGSACSSLRKKYSGTLSAMKIDKKTAFSSVRISTGFETSENDIKSFSKVFIEEVKKLTEIY